MAIAFAVVFIDNVPIYAPPLPTTFEDLMV
jgi:hypothetical protein